MAKAVYGRTFTWLVNKINSSLVNKVRPHIFGWLTLSNVVMFYNWHHHSKEFVSISRWLLMGRVGVLQRLHFQHTVGSQKCPLNDCVSKRGMHSICSMPDGFCCTQKFLTLTVVCFNMYKKKIWVLQIHPKWNYLSNKRGVYSKLEIKERVLGHRVHYCKTQGGSM